MNNLAKLKESLSKIDDLNKLKYWNQFFLDWKKETLELLIEIYWETNENVEFFNLIKFNFINSIWISEDILNEKYLKWLDIAKNLLSKFIENLSDTKSEELKILENIFNKFSDVSKQLEKRYWQWKRTTIKVNDEYDVQDLLHWLFKLYFDDIRAEERNPSYAWSSKRSDFLLKNEKIIIEVKKTNKNLKDKHIWEQLIIDIANYKKHNDCDFLVCFIYDPEKFIKNPRWIEKDLEDTQDLNVKVYIRN